MFMSCSNDASMTLILRRIVGGADVEGSEKVKRNIARIYFNIFTMNW
jgi:hypothetical protein